MVGVVLPANIRRVFEKTRSKLLDGPLDLSEDDQQIEYMEKYVTLHQWKAIVKRFLFMMKTGQPLGTAVDIISGVTANSVQKNDKSDEDSFDDQEEEFQTETKRANNYESVNKRRGRFEEDDDSISDDDRIQKKDRKIISKPETGHPNYMKKIKSVPSRLGDVIKLDKMAYKEKKHRTDTAALSAIAKKRVDILTSNMPPYTIKDPNFFPGSRIAKVQDVNRLKDLESGAATLEIADAF